MDLTKHHVKVESTSPFVICDNYIKGGMNSYIFGLAWKNKFNTTLKSMFDCIQKLEKDESIGDFSYTPVEECINFLTSLIVEKQTDVDMIEFIKQFVFLAYNLNQNLNKYEAVDKKISYLQRYCDSALTFAETLNLMANVSKRLSNWREWIPPSFRLSGHYYDLLKEV